MDDSYNSGWVKRRGQILFRKYQNDLHQNADHLFRLLMFLQLGLLVGVAFLITPTTWIGDTSDWQFHVVGAVLLGSILTALTFFLTRSLAAAPITRHTIAICQMVWSMMFIHMSGGRMELHFHIFASLALLTFYRDWKILLTASVVISLDHFFRGCWLPSSLFGESKVSHLRWLVGVGWILLSDAILVSSCFQVNHLARELCRKQANLEESNREIEQLAWSRTKDLKTATRSLRGAVKAQLEVEHEYERLADKLMADKLIQFQERT